MNFKIGDRVKVSTIEDVGTVGMVVLGEVGFKYLVYWDSTKHLGAVWYPAYQVRLAEEEGTCPWCCRDGCDGSCHKSFIPVSEKPTRLSRKEIRKELKKIDDDNRGNLMGLQAIVVIGWMEVEHPKRKEIRARLRQLSAESFCVDKVFAERIDKIADGV